MGDEMLFEAGTERAGNEDTSGGTPRVQRRVRDQLEFVPTELNSLLPDDHQARTVWSYVEKADLSKEYAAIRAVEGGVGRAPIDPRILLALWLYATLDGVGRARTAGTA